jgi:hypothetical protein
MPGTPNEGAPPVEGKPKAKPLLALIVLIVALGLFAAAFFYAGGMDYVNQLLGNTGGAVGRPAPKPGATAPSYTGVPAAVERRMYIEQIESAPRIARLAAGEGTEITFNAVASKTATETWVAVTARFNKEPATINGVMCFEKVAANWYFMWLQEYVGAGAADADALTQLPLHEPYDPTNEEYAEFNITTVDQGVIDAVILSQSADQALVKGIMDGTYTSLTLDKPEKGVGTIRIPVTLTGSAGSVKGAITLLTKMIDGKDRTFVASFKKQ